VLQGAARRNAAVKTAAARRSLRDYAARDALRGEGGFLSGSSATALTVAAGAPTLGRGRATSGSTLGDAPISSEPLSPRGGSDQPPKVSAPTQANLRRARKMRSAEGCPKSSTRLSKVVFGVDRLVFFCWFGLLFPKVGDAVEARYRGRAHWFAATIEAARADGTYFVR
jgi:hypothetical protein